MKKLLNLSLIVYVPDSSLYIICVFYSGRIRTLLLLWQLEVSIDLYGEKWKLAFSVVRLGIFEFCFYINVY